MDIENKRVSISRCYFTIILSILCTLHAYFSEMGQQKNSRVHWKQILLLLIVGLSALLCSAQALSHRSIFYMLSFILVIYFRRRNETSEEPSEEPTGGGGDSVETQSSQSVSFILGVLGEWLNKWIPFFITFNICATINLPEDVYYIYNNISLCNNYIHGYMLFTLQCVIDILQVSRIKLDAFQMFWCYNTYIAA